MVGNWRKLAGKKVLFRGKDHWLANEYENKGVMNKGVMIDGDGWPSAKSYIRYIKGKYGYSWKRVRLQVMMRVLAAKFTQDKMLWRKLLKTNTATLVYDTKKDRFWGCGKDGNGKNTLGQLLMDLRRYLCQMMYITGGMDPYKKVQVY